MSARIRSDFKMTSADGPCGSKLQIVVFVGFYLPGFKAGGPLRTIFHMVEHLSDCFEFWIVTRDRDLGDDVPYKGIVVDTWVELGASRVFYCPPERQTINGFASVINSRRFDILYLNSFFDPVFTIKPLIAKRLGRIRSLPIVLAPRGEFSKSALELRRVKKWTFIAFARCVRLYYGIIWQASSVHESEDIKARHLVSRERDVVIALDLPEVERLHQRDLCEASGLVSGDRAFRIVFLSRISPMKNLDFALRILGRVSADVVFDIFGPLGDRDYWLACQELIKSLPDNVRVTYRGEVIPSRVKEIFSRYELFLFPTRGENYGHVVAESLMVGTPVLLSDQTPWRRLADDGLGWDLPLQDVSAFVTVIDSLALRTNGERALDREYVRRKALARIYDPAVLRANRELFLNAIR